ncbi:MAG TPA: Gfo/Idh/MocA family oxidoreductase, partial [Syntrophales bacterium]|nr:Gfo/Idh/MocA family oxidoreductase [Syntrophales bacterium]
MKIGIVGCGLNSDYHINFARTYQGANIVGVVDRDREKAQECATRFNIKGVFSSIKDLVDKAGPEVVHILTPPRTHFAVAKEAMESGCHVLVEKPLGLNYEEAKELYDVAEREGVQLCTMHNHFYDPCMSKAHAFVQEGQLGQVINVESYYGLNTQISAFRDYPAPNVLPWLYNLPGGVYQDFMPHPLYVLLEYTGAPQEIKVMQQSHGVLPQGMADEIRILIKGEKAFGTLTFSFVARPHLHFVRIYGTKMMVEVDINTMTTIDHPLSSLPKAAQKA